MENSKKKSLKWLWITLALVIVAAIAAWCIFSAIKNPKIETVSGQTTTLNGVENILNFKATFALFTIAFIVLAIVL